MALEFEQIHAFDVERSAGCACTDDDRQAHGGFRRGHHDHEEHEHLALQLVRARG